MSKNYEIAFRGHEEKSATKAAKAFLKQNKAMIKVGDTIDNDADGQTEYWKWQGMKLMTKTGTTKDLRLIHNPAQYGGRRTRKRMSMSMSKCMSKRMSMSKRSGSKCK